MAHWAHLVGSRVIDWQVVVELANASPWRVRECKFGLEQLASKLAPSSPANLLACQARVGRQARLVEPLGETASSSAADWRQSCGRDDGGDDAEATTMEPAPTVAQCSLLAARQPNGGPTTKASLPPGQVPPDWIGCSWAKQVGQPAPRSHTWAPTQVTRAHSRATWPARPAGKKSTTAQATKSGPKLICGPILRPSAQLAATYCHFQRLSAIVAADGQRQARSSGELRVPKLAHMNERAAQINQCSRRSTLGRKIE